MPERDVTSLSGPLGPLDRLRAQLAGPRGYRRIDALLSSDDAAGAIAALAPNEIFELVHEVGFEDAADLINLATPAQIQGCLDLDGWAKDEFELVSLQPWLSAVLDSGFEKLGEVWRGLDIELRALIFQRGTKIYDVTLGEGPEEDNDEPIYTTPDSFFMLELPQDDMMQRLMMRLVEDLYRADGDLARHAIMAARSEPPAEIEENSYRWRAGRLADLGYVDFYEALDLFRPLDPSQVQIGEGTQYRLATDDQRLPTVVAEQVLGRSFLARALAALREPGEAERLEAGMMALVNKVLAAGRAKPGQAEVVNRGALYATATLSLGLETISRGDIDRATQALDSIGFERLFRVGYTVTQKLARLALALAPRSITSSSPTRDLVSALCTPRPLFARAADDPPAPGVRPFESSADLRRAGELLTALTVRIALVESLGIDVVAAGQTPEPRPTLDDHIRTAIARVIASDGPRGELRGDALSQAELTVLRQRLADPAAMAVARADALTAVRARLSATQVQVSAPIVAGLVDGWLSELQAILGAIKDAEIDPRFVEGVLVELRRS